MNEQPLVNFVVVGPGKCGTTWLYGLMRAHAEICESSVKETLFFESFHHKGYRWYESHFDYREQHKAAGEVSNTYISDSAVAKRIHAYNPGMKIVVTVRDPIDRALSHYTWHLRNGRVPGTFAEALKVDAYGLLDRGLYYTKLKPYLDLFGPGNIKVQVFEDLRTDQHGYAGAFLRFVGVDPAVPHVEREKFQLEASMPRSRIVAMLLKAGARAARSFGRPSWVQKVKESAVPTLAYRRIRQDERPTVSDRERIELQDYFREEVRNLSAFLGRDLEALWFGEARMGRTAGRSG